MQNSINTDKQASREENTSLPVGYELENYTIKSVLGIGAFGISYAAHDNYLDISVVIKEYFPNYIALRSTESQRILVRDQSNIGVYEFGLNRFIEEARVLAKFNHKHIIKVRQYIKHNDSAYIIMDYEHGVPLSRYLLKHLQLSESQIKSTFYPLLLGLLDVHEKKYLHRDIKPSNIFLRKQHGAILIDFGAARHALICTSKQASTVIGTQDYAPHEQFSRYEPQGAWTDIYSIGACLYHCITGHAPFTAFDRVSASMNNSEDPLIPAIDIAKGQYSTELLSCIDHMLTIRPQNRPQSVRDIISIFKTVDEKDTVISQNDIKWDESLVSTTTEHLSEILGPISTHLVKQSINTSKSTEELYSMLSKHIDDPDSRADFMKLSNTFQTNKTQSRIKAKLEDNGTSDYERHSITRAQAESLTRALLYHIGPIAGMLVKKALKTTNNNIKKAGALLEKEIPSDAARREFRRVIEREL